jgi:hypothetical protein
MDSRPTVTRWPGQDVQLHQRAQGCFRLAQVSYGDKQVTEIYSFVTLIKKAALTTAKEADGNPPRVKQSVGGKCKYGKEK